jgi:hypothetical protein
MLKANDQIKAQIKAQAQNQFKKMAALTGVMLIAAGEALAQENSSRPVRRIVVSIPDRKLAVLEGDRIVRIFQTAVGAPHSPTPPGTPKARLCPRANAIPWARGGWV